MALSKSNLGFPVTVASGTTTAVYTVSGGKTAYIRSIVVYNNTVATPAAAGLAQSVQIYMVPNNAGAVGTAAAGNRIARVALTSDDTFSFEFQYPLTLQNNGDSIQVQNEGVGFSTSSVNVIVLGDKEA